MVEVQPSIPLLRLIQVSLSNITSSARSPPHTSTLCAMWDTDVCSIFAVSVMWFLLVNRPPGDSINTKVSSFLAVSQGLCVTDTSIICRSSALGVFLLPPFPHQTKNSQNLVPAFPSLKTQKMKLPFVDVTGALDNTLLQPCKFPCTQCSNRIL